MEKQRFYTGKRIDVKLSFIDDSTIEKLNKLPPSSFNLFFNRAIEAYIKYIDVKEKELFIA